MFVSHYWVLITSLAGCTRNFPKISPLSFVMDSYITVLGMLNFQGHFHSAIRKQGCFLLSAEGGSPPHPPTALGIIFPFHTGIVPVETLEFLAFGFLNSAVNNSIP